MLILDTNVISECMRPVPDSSVLSWLRHQATASVFLTSITIAEIQYGVELLPVGSRKEKIRTIVQAMLHEDFMGRILPFDQEAASAYAEIASNRRQMGRPISQFDCQIAAIAKTRGAVVVTRNRGC
jgi:predicted nucleic acid-binding protein